MDDNAVVETSDIDRRAWQQFFLGRMTRLVDLRARSLSRLNQQGTRLINRAIYSTYLDCHRVGVGNRARSILERASRALLTQQGLNASGPHAEHFDA